MDTQIMDPAKKGLFYSRKDEKDVRLGEIAKAFSGKVSEGDIAIIGVPEERGIIANKGRIGAKEAPDRIRECFYKLCPGFGKLPSIIDMGDVRESVSVEEAQRDLASIVDFCVLRGAIPICMGGGNEITHGTFTGLRSLKKTGCINFDAHFDVRDMRYGVTSGTSHFMNIEFSKILDGKNLVEFGNQENKSSSIYRDYLLSKKAEILPLFQIRKVGIEKSLKRALAIAGKGTNGILASFDMDSVRSSDAPGVSAPSSSGFFAEEAERIAYVCGKAKNVRAFEIVEVCPKYDVDNRTSRLAASVMWHFIKGVSER